MLCIAAIAANWLANRWPREVENELEMEYETYEEFFIVDLGSDVVIAVPESTGAKIINPSQNDTDKELVTNIGTIKDSEDMVTFKEKIDVEDCLELEWEVEPILYGEYKDMNIVDFDSDVSSAAYQSVDMDNEDDIMNELEWEYEFVQLYDEDEINVDIDWDVLSEEKLVS